MQNFPVPRAIVADGLAFLVHFVEICQYFVGTIFFVMIVVRVPIDGILLSSSFSRENFLK